MPRRAREQSQTDTYHVMLRGINRQQIFFDKEDYQFFERLLGHYKSICGFKLYAYCIMGNHVHLLIHTGEEPLDKVFKRIGGAFVYWYNAKYERSGHLFQDRFRSEAVNDARYFMTVFRYILRNPVNAGICKKPEDYAYSSIGEYLYSERGITDTDFVMGMLDEKDLKRYIREDNDDQCMEMNNAVTVRKCTDTRAKELILREFGTFSPVAGKVRGRQELKDSLRRLKTEGVSIRQLCRLTGLSKKVVENSLKRS